MGFLKELGKAFMTTPDAKLGMTSLHDGRLHWGASSKEIAGATAVFEHGADQKRVTITRVGAGALLFGPVGAIVGGMLRKDTTKVYVIVTFADEQQAIIDVPARMEREAREFTARLNEAA